MKSVVPAATPNVVLTYDLPGWTTGGGVAVSIDTDTTVPNYPPKIAHFTFGLGGDGVTLYTLPGLVVGQVYTLAVRCNFDGVGDDTLRLRFTYNASQAKFFAKDASISGWETRDIGSFTYDIANRIVRITGLDTGGLGVAKVHALYVGYQTIPETFSPVQNGQGPQRWQTWHEDDIMGTPMPRSAAFRDKYDRLVDFPSWGVDADGHDELFTHPRPRERTRRDP